MRSFVCAIVLPMALATQAVAEPRSFAAPAGDYLIEALFPDITSSAPLGRAAISVRERSSLHLLQQFETAAANPPLTYGNGSQEPMIGEGQLLQVGDFNFDGKLDLAIRNGSTTTHGAMFDVYLQAPQGNHWSYHPALSEAFTDSRTFRVYEQPKVLSIRSNRGCCWTQTNEWQWQGEQLVRLSSFTREDIDASNYDSSSSMPRGYARYTRGSWKDGKWQEVSSIEGPDVGEAQRFVGTLDGKIPVELWYQDQGAVIIGEVRYPRSGNGMPIKLVGERAIHDDSNPVYLYEYSADGRRSGYWSLKTDYSREGASIGTWSNPATPDAKQRVVDLQRQDFELSPAAFDSLTGKQRNGRYQALDDFLGRDGVLDLQILPERDAQGREIAQLTFTLKDSKTGQQITTEQLRAPLEADNLIIVRDYSKVGADGPFHIQLMQHFAVVEYNVQADSRDMFTGRYRKLP